MDNIQALKNGSQSQAVFINTILTLKDSQGFYCRLYNAVIDLDGDGLKNLQEVLDSQNFNNDIDVIFWLES